MVPPDSARIPRVPAYSGTEPSMWRAFKVRGLHPLRRTFPDPSPMRASMPVSPAPPYNPAMHRCTAVWAPPLSLAATQGISFDFLSCRYLDGSLPCVSPRRAMCSPAGGSHPDHRVTPFGHLRIVGRWHLPAAFRSYPRPSSSGSSQASSVDPSSLDHIILPVPSLLIPKNLWRHRDSNPGPSACKADALAS